MSRLTIDTNMVPTVDTRLSPLKTDRTTTLPIFKMDQRSIDRSACSWSLRAHLPLSAQWPRLNSISGPKCKNRSPLGHQINPPSGGVLNGVAALVTSATGDEGASQRLPICAGPGPAQTDIDGCNLRSSPDHRGPQAWRLTARTPASRVRDSRC
jgi:hypothetical protein